MVECLRPRDLPWECTAQPNVHTSEMFGEKISAKACSGKEIAGLLKKIRKTMNNKYDDTRISEILGYLNSRTPPAE